MLDIRKHIVDATDLQCSDDQDAVRAAARMRNFAGLEVWSGVRHVAILPPNFDRWQATSDRPNA